MIENALFEEDQKQAAKARKIYEQIQSEIAPDYIKNLIMFINFEKRQNNTEKVKELYYRVYSNAINESKMELQVQTLNYIVFQYARYLTFTCKDTQGASNIIKQALMKTRYSSKAFLLNSMSFLKYMEGSFSQYDFFQMCYQIYEKALFDEGVGSSSSQSELKQEDKQEVARYFMEFLQEYAPQVSLIRQTESKLKDAQLLYSRATQNS